VRTTATATACLAAATRAAGGDVGRLEKERAWRENYARHFVDHVTACATSAEAATRAARAGLDFVYDCFTFTRPGAAASAAPALLREAMEDPMPRAFATAVLDGGGARADAPAPSLSMPYNGKVLNGASLVAQADAWARQGVIEPSAAAAVRAASVLGASGRLATALAGHVFAVMGAGAEMGPTATLLSLGATIVAVDLDGRPFMWQRLLGLARASRGRLVVPVRRRDGDGDAEQLELPDEELCERAGANLLTDTPEVAAWLSSVCPGQAMTVGAYAYLDGAAFVRISVAQDAIATAVLRRRPGTSLSYLCTPTDIFLRPLAARRAALQRYEERPAWMRFLATSSCSRLMSRNAVLDEPLTNGDGVEVDVVDCTVSQQGPNYLFAKRIQHWRAVVARAGGAVVSSNIAPSSATVSVTKAKLLKAAFDGVRYVPPIEVFQPATANAAMAIALLHDIFDADSAAHPTTPLSHPLLLFADGAWHGGMWRCGVKVGSAAVPAAVIGLAIEHSSSLMGGGALATVGVGLLLRSRL